MSGVSEGRLEKSLVKRLGIKDGFRVAVLNAPPEYHKRLGESMSIKILETLPSHPLDFIQFFTTSNEKLGHRFPELEKSLTQKGMLWISWPKHSSGVRTDLDDTVVREIGLRNGLVDVKVAAIDETWSGLKFVRRLKDRR